MSNVNSLAQSYGVHQGGYGVRQSEYRGPLSGGPGKQAGNLQSTSFVFETGQLNPHHVQAHSLATSTSLYGAKESVVARNPLHPAGTDSEG